MRLPSYVLLCCLLANTLQCYASSFLLVNSGNGEVYSRFKTNLSTLLKKIDHNNTLSTSTLSNLKLHTNTTTSIKYDAIITAGIEASIAISRLDLHTMVIMAMLPKQSYRKLSADGEIVCKPQNCHVVLIDQPIARQLRLIRLALPDSKHVAIIGSIRSSVLIKKISQNATSFGLAINMIIISDDNSLLSALNQKLTNSDVLMAIPDQMVYNRDTARAILLTTFNQGIPLFAYSRSFVLAGATIGIYSTPEEIARHVANLASAPAHLTNLPHVLYPKYFSVDVNRRAAEALNLNIPATKVLLQRLKAYEKD